MDTLIAKNKMNSLGQCYGVKNEIGFDLVIRTTDFLCGLPVPNKDTRDLIVLGRRINRDLVTGIFVNQEIQVFYLNKRRILDKDYYFRITNIKPLKKFLKKGHF